MQKIFFGGIAVDFSSALTRFRRDFKVTQKQAAAAAGVSERNFQDYEYGKVVPAVTVVIALADSFDVSTDYLLGRTDDPTRH